MARNVPNPNTDSFSRAWIAVAVAIGGAIGGGALWLLSELVPQPGSRRPRAPAVELVKHTYGSENTGVGEGNNLPKAARPRTARAPVRPPPALAAFTSAYDWPREPVAPAPADVAEQRFSDALVLLCGPDTAQDVRDWYASWVLRYAREFGVDPFLLGALVFRQSQCRRTHEGNGLGLTGIAPELYAADLLQGTYRYRAFENGSWSERKIEVAKFPFTPDFIVAPESNLYFASAFLRAWQEQQRGLFAAFVHKEYRHYVSHFLWGDRVQSARQEDWILVDRRRLLEYYGARTPLPPVEFRGVQLGCPLDGCPRLVTSTLGDSRDEGKRAHRGTDFESTRGEPVRAVADGTVWFAGVDLPGKHAAKRLPIYAQRSVARSLMGAGGLYVCIRHGDADKANTLVSCYMHLDSVMVVEGRRIKRGDQVGRVGNTGIKISAPHLHFELHTGDEVQAAEKVLAGLALGKPPVDALEPSPDEEAAASERALTAADP